MRRSKTLRRLIARPFDQSLCRTLSPYLSPAVQEQRRLKRVFDPVIGEIPSNHFFRFRMTFGIAETT